MGVAGFARQTSQVAVIILTYPAAPTPVFRCRCSRGRVGGKSLRSALNIERSHVEGLTGRGAIDSMGLLSCVIVGDHSRGFSQKYVVPGEGMGGVLGDLVIGIVGAFNRRLDLQRPSSRRRDGPEPVEHRGGVRGRRGFCCSSRAC